MKKSIWQLMVLVMAFSMVLSACGNAATATSAPAATNPTTGSAATEAPTAAPIAEPPAQIDFAYLSFNKKFLRTMHWQQ